MKVFSNKGLDILICFKSLICVWKKDIYYQKNNNQIAVQNRNSIVNSRISQINYKIEIRIRLNLGIFNSLLFVSQRLF